MSGLRKRQATNYNMFEDDDSDLTDGEKLDVRLRNEDSSNDGSVYTSPESAGSSSENYSSPVSKKPKPKFHGFVPPIRKEPVPSTSKNDQGETKEEGETVEDIMKSLASNKGDEDKENVTPEASPGGEQFKMLNRRNKMATLLKRATGKYSTELLVKVVERTARVIEEKQMSYQKVCLRFQELVIVPMMADKILTHNGKSVKDFSSRWCRNVRNLRDDDEGMEQFHDEELPGVVKSLEIIQQHSDTEEKKKPVSYQVREAYLPSGNLSG